MRNRIGQVRKEKTARKNVKKRIRKEERKANPAPGPTYAWRGRERMRVREKRTQIF
jgi:hypothetical protein